MKYTLWLREILKKMTHALHDFRSMGSMQQKTARIKTNRAKPKPPFIR